MSHKAFRFDWPAFQLELSSILMNSLTKDDATALIDFGNANLATLCDPYEGAPLTRDWISNLEVGGTQEIADHVLTKYYDPTADQGLGEHWITLNDSLGADQRPALLGKKFGPPSNNFDPGKMGS